MCNTILFFNFTTKSIESLAYVTKKKHWTCLLFELTDSIFKYVRQNLGTREICFNSFPSPPTAACCWIYFKYHTLPMTRDHVDILLRAFWVPASAVLWGKIAQNCVWTVNSVSVIKTLNRHHILRDIMFFKSKCFRVNIRYDVLILLAMCYFKNRCSQTSKTDPKHP